jgi:CubicO group peptidase (beta-lactamase class C family)
VRWLRLHLGGGAFDGRRLISEATMHEMHRPRVLGVPVPALGNNFLAYAMGWQCRDTPDGTILLHEGSEFGVSTFTILDPQRKLGAAIYTNLGSSLAAKALAYTLIDVLAARSQRDWAELFRRIADEEYEIVRRQREAEVARYAQSSYNRKDAAGTYFHPANGVMDIRETAEGLDFRVRDGWVYDAVLEPLEGNLYRGRNRYLGMQSLARHDVIACFFRDSQGLALYAPGLGVARKVA